MTKFQEVAETLESIAGVSSRIEKISQASVFLKKLQDSEIGPAALFLSGKAFSERDSRSLNASWSTLLDALQTVVQFTPEDMEKAYSGDAGQAVQRILSSDKYPRQSSLFSEDLTIGRVGSALDAISQAEGAGSKREREAILSALFRDASPLEARYLTAIILGDLRTGMSEGLMIDAIARAFETDSSLTRKAWHYSGDLQTVAETAASHGETGLQSIKVELLRPVRPMLATSADSLQDAFGEIGEKAALELKLDGARIQVHKHDEEIRIYSRRLSDVTDSMPEVDERIRANVIASSVILDGEVIALDKEGTPFPFQVVMRRYGSKLETQEELKEIRLRPFFFDILHLDGRELVELPYTERRSILENLVSAELLVETLQSANLGAATKFFERSQRLGHEGVMVKRADSEYVPGTRGKNWFKVKHTLEPLDLVITAAEWGHGRRHNWLSDYHLAVLNKETGGFEMVGKTFKGLTDQEFEEMTKRLQEIETESGARIVRVKPEIVVEVLASEIQKSPKYRSGMALRFARITAIRYDKGPDDATTLKELEKLYEDQFKFKAKYQGTQKKF